MERELDISVGRAVVAVISALALLVFFPKVALIALVLYGVYLLIAAAVASGIHKGRQP